MPLIAQQASTGDRIDITEYQSRDQVLLKFSAGDIQCPYCQGQMHLVAPNGRLMFWRHNSACGSDVSRTPESALHLACKRTILEFLKAKTHESAVIQLEFHLPNIGQNGRVADIAVLYPTGHTLVYEIQASKITVEEIASRSSDYQHAGIDDHWIFTGKAAESQYLIDWAIENYAYAGCINVLESMRTETVPLY